MAKKESYHQKAARIGKNLLQASRAMDKDLGAEIELLRKWSGDADELVIIARELEKKALQLAEETDVAAHKKLEGVDIMAGIIQESATLAMLFQDDSARYVLALDVEGYYQFSMHIQSDARVAAWRRLSDMELTRIHQDWKSAVKNK